uniref:RNA 3'-terminal phosphate cyclase n=1 Tax=uncultured Thiotrichaceae bacterium TaxID=298394 RepID=A0A6S6UKA3_9GAMM|nr:MAG: RNA 3'-terminal phosphate cyclase (EC [uncultured Thiotrichaceae bacterium]
MRIPIDGIIDSNGMKIIDGSLGEGGGQIVRSALALSMCTGTTIKIENIRSGRRKPGLLRQHLTCVLASQKICSARVDGAELGSSYLLFEPGKIQSGDYDFDIGTAGSTCLVFQTVLPALLMAEGVSTVKLRGGTHNMMAPSFDFIKHSFLPLLQRMNIDVTAELNAFGFYPAGGGEWIALINPSSVTRSVKLMERGELESREAVVTQSGIDRRIAGRELAVVKKKLGFSDSELIINEVESAGQGNILSLRFHYADVTEVIDSIGQRGVRAEKVADSAVKSAIRYVQSGAVVGEHLCDQLLLPMALGKGGCFTTLEPTLHTKTNCAVIQAFIDCEIEVKALADYCFEMRVSK